MLLVCTSGTTGGPKAAVHTQANLLANMAIAARAQELRPADTVLTVLPLFHVGGLCIQTLPALYAGAGVILHARFSPDATLDCIAGDRPALTLQVPATMKALVDHPRWASTDLSSLRAVWAGSSVLPDELVRAFHARGVPVCNVYGATETGPFSIALTPAHAFDHVGSCGWPAPGVEARAGARHGDAAELLLRGPNVVARYWPDQPTCDADGWFATGDLARRAHDGSWRIVGRARDLIISGGENIHPLEIEQVLMAHPAVAECAAFGVPDARWGELVAVAVVLKPGASAAETDLQAHVAGRLARFKQPRRWFWPRAAAEDGAGQGAAQPAGAAGRGGTGAQAALAHPAGPS
ncbi:AMP-binding protein [Ramlibacter terrae]|uniref:AMP-binding protein n=1 Tax=Ramlibacter terrae TaxID=2732511 RepID=A0ABX6NZT8_9BURK|nr:AMP-binding protein [Ramlibacter terrae]